MGIKTVPHLPYSPDLAPCDFCLFPKHRGCRYETIEAMEEAVTKVIDTLTQEDFDGAFQKLLERYNKCIAARGDYFEGDLSFMCVLSIKVPIRKKSLETYLMILVHGQKIIGKKLPVNLKSHCFTYTKKSPRHTHTHTHRRKITVSGTQNHTNARTHTQRQKDIKYQ